MKLIFVVSVKFHVKCLFRAFSYPMNFSLPDRIIQARNNFKDVFYPVKTCLSERIKKSRKIKKNIF